MSSTAWLSNSLAFEQLSERHPSAVRAEVLEGRNWLKEILHIARENADDEALAEHGKALALGHPHKQ